MGNGRIIARYSTSDFVSARRPIKAGDFDGPWGLDPSIVRPVALPHAVEAAGLTSSLTALGPNTSNFKLFYRKVNSTPEKTVNTRVAPFLAPFKFNPLKRAEVG